MPIKMKNINYTYQKGRPFEKVALQDLSLEIKDKKIVGIIGGTGSGKTTLLLLLAGLLRPQKGQLIIDGETKKAGKKPLLDNVGLVFQFSERQFIQENVLAEIAYSLTWQGLDKATIKNRVAKSMELVGLPWIEFKNRKLTQLSSGEKRRVAIATILALDTKYILLDEPTVGLDYPGRQDLKKTLLKLQNDKKTIVVVSHNLSFLLKISDEIHLMSAGRIIMTLSKDFSLAEPDSLRQFPHPWPAYMETAMRLKEKGYKLSLNQWYHEDKVAREIISQLLINQ